MNADARADRAPTAAEATPPSQAAATETGRGAPPPPAAGPVARLISRPLFWVVLLLFLFGVPLGRSLLRRVPPPPPVLGALPSFALVDQTGAPFGAAQLRGKVWIADFIFTACPTVCPALTQTMAGLLSHARYLGPDFHLVSFTVDPENDTPAKLAAYGARYGADARKWSFLTGSVDAIKSAVVDGFKIGMGKEKVKDPAGAEFWQIFHGEHFVLVDRDLHIRGYYDGSKESQETLLRDAAAVLASASF